ncbi:TetR/AcrR family transcriptional regulator [Microbacterium indicum]|uniref:TetR/AcrR family transcriptional regulator n=1 Tax=Microbacterium indicum TaxID=358100 RepID=UPI0012EB593A|nr:TetR/AcrR family transcriptional regulator [Microbacterium indicum]
MSDAGPTTSAEKERLLELVADLILRDGVIGLSLSGIARGIGSNNRMLLYYFGSKQELLDDASVRAFERHPRLRTMFDRLHEEGDLEDLLIRAWEDLSSEENIPYLRVYFQSFGVAMRDGDEWESFTRRSRLQWVDLATSAIRQHGHDAERARIAATAIVALWRGLQMALISGGDREILRRSYAAGVAGAVAAL